MYADDYNGWLPKEAISEGDRWAGLLLTKGYVKGNKTKGNNIFVCPSFYPFKWSNDYYTYGMTVERQRGFTADDRWMCLKRMPRPSSLEILIDNVNSGLIPPPQYYWIPRNLSPHSISPHLRHAGKANALFADMHVEAIGPGSQLADNWKSSTLVNFEVVYPSAIKK